MSIIPVVQADPHNKMPAGACDCHCHIFGPQARFAYAEGRRYTPDDATFEDYSALMTRLGTHAAVFVQPTPYGKDHACVSDALARLGGRGRGIAIIDETTTEGELGILANAGFVGTRVGLTHNYGPSIDSLEGVANRLNRLGWHMQFTMDVALLTDLGKRLDSLPVDLVFDHVGRGDLATGVEEPGFQKLLTMLRAGRCWVKLSAPYYTSKTGAPYYDDLMPRIDLMVRANADRILWATNWPHTSTDDHPDNGDLVDALVQWIPDESLRRKILVENPAALYGIRTIVS